MSTSRTAQRPSSVAYLPRSHRSPLSARTRAEAILPALALTLTYFKKLTLLQSFALFCLLGHRADEDRNLSEPGVFEVYRDKFCGSIKVGGHNRGPI